MTTSFLCFLLFQTVVCVVMAMVAVQQQIPVVRGNIQTKYYTFDLPTPSISNIKTRYTYAPAKKQPLTLFSSSKKPSVVCMHGFGGNADQWRKNLPVLAAEGHDSFALDLLGYGYSDKPNPKDYQVNEVYNFENWAYQTVSFLEKTVKSPCILVANSVGCVAALEAARRRPDLIQGIVLIDISLRLLHVKKQNPLARPFVSALQTVLRETGVGKAFFDSVAKPATIKNILMQAYAGPVDDETVQLILEPGLAPGAAAVFLDFISYSSGPLPEELLPQVKVPVRILWGENDPWEPIKMGRMYGDFPIVDEFVTLPGGGHCPMDQIDDDVNREILRFLKKF